MILDNFRKTVKNEYVKIYLYLSYNIIINNIIINY